MHDISFFLLKNWLPVGVSAIVFFGIGLLLAKLTWGRFSQRLTFAIEENINLAGQWSALGASQRDLFKKLRVRWQADRDLWESAILEKDNRISELTRQFMASGREVPGEPVVDTKLHLRVEELEAALKTEKAEVNKLREEAESVRSVDDAPDASARAATLAVSDLQARIRDLEQDLIDTHDKLHDVRVGYDKQSNLVESLEARLIQKPGPKVVDELSISSVKIAELESKLAEAERFSRDYATELSQLKALLPQRNRELKCFRSEFANLKREDASTRNSLGSDFNERLESIEVANAAERIGFETRLTALSGDLVLRKNEMTALEGELLAKTEELAAAREKIVELEVLHRRKASLQAELNDACHELYDVRRALNQRIGEIGDLEVKLAELADTEAKNVELAKQLVETREELAATIHALSKSGEELNDSVEELADLRQAYNETVLEGESLNRQLGAARHELSDARLAYNAKVSDFQTARAQMEELEAIIEDRTAEVNDLSTELRTQRDLVRQLKNTLAETEGELEALVDESKVLNAGVNARNAYGEEQRLRIAALELALSQRYNELNIVRADADDYSRKSRHFEAQAKQLGAEIERRSAEFIASDLRVVNAEEAVEAANAKIAALSGKLEQSEKVITQLQEDLRQVSRDKDETIRELDRATRRITQLEEAAKTRESQLSQVESELRESRELAGNLDLRVAQLNTELASEREKQEVSRMGIAKLEEALRVSDERTHQLSGRLEEKEREAGDLDLRVTQLNSELASAREEQEISRMESAKLEETLRASDERTHQLSGRLEEKEREAGDLDLRLKRLNVELESAREEQKISRMGIAELEEALRASDERTLQLSGRLEERELEVYGQLEELAALRASLDAREAGEVEAEVRLAALQSELEAKLGRALQEHEILSNKHQEKADRQTAEIEKLKGVIRDQAAKLEEDAGHRNRSLSDITELQEKLEKRMEIIRDLQVQVNTVMMQRSSRDSEISMLKDKLSAVEEDLRNVREKGAIVVIEPVSTPPGLVSDVGDVSLAAAIQQSLDIESSDEAGTSLDDLTGKTTHHTPQKSADSAAYQGGIAPKRQPGNDDAIYFSESTSTLSASEIEKIDQCARAIRRFGRKAEVTVIGYAGAEGTPDFTETLSARRADAVRERLLERGVSQAVVSVRGAGQDRRFSDWRAQRVEMIVAPLAVAETVN